MQQQALSLAVDAGNKRLEGMHNGKLGNTHLALAQYDDAEGHFERSLRIARERKDVLLEAITLGQLGDCLLYTSPSPRDRTRSRMPSSA